MIRTIVYRDSKLVGEAPAEELAELRAEPGVMLWVDLAQPTDEEARAVLNDVFGVHPLTIEDCLLDTPLPKLEAYDDYLYLVMHSVDFSPTEKFTTIEIDFILGTNFLVTLHGKPSRPIDVARERARRSPATLVRGPDRLAHNVLDLLVDYYRPALAALRTEVEELEEAVLARGRGRLDARIIELRGDLTSLRQIIRPQRELTAELAQGRTKFFRPKLLPYLRDLNDELVRIEEMVVSWSEQMILVFRVYLNRSSHEANEGIRVLTALTAVTLPLLVIGGWFGMNFNRMPMLQSRAAYWIVLAATVSMSAGLFFLLRRRRWF
ncbi:magnesium/cobalt transporter CorA [Opitutales bacterium ASA1]|uniref:magnesium transporter CorA family protein n=1 Tax=Congregicoccus parvus TaxID=3081749 RepID=UPI002B321257|nr:magnesium/cobalt transporter CorA [Opitutales bacterium ASA1]